MKSKLTLLITLLLLFFVCKKGNTQAPYWQWAISFGTSTPIGSHCYGYSTAVDSSGNIYTTGIFSETVDFDPGPGVFNLSGGGGFISKLDVSGNFVWTKAWQGISTSIKIDSFGDIYVAGTFGGTVDFDPGPNIFNLTSIGGNGYVSKFDSSGNFIWAGAIGEPNANSGINPTALAIDAAGNIYTTGNYRGAAVVDFNPGPGVYNLPNPPNIYGYYIFISKLNSAGNLLWAKGMGGYDSQYNSSNSGTSIAIDASGNVYTTGSFMGTPNFSPLGSNLTSSGSRDIFILKLNSYGNFLWVKGAQGNSSTNVVGNCLVLDAIGNVYATGTFDGYTDFNPGIGVYAITGNNSDIFILKLDALGNFIWVKVMGGTGQDQGISITLDQQDNIYTTGAYGAYGNGQSDFDPGPGVFNLPSVNQADVFVSKLDNVGNFIWAKGMGGMLHDEGSSIALNPSGNVYITGYFRSPFLSFDSYGLTSTDTSGNKYNILIAKLDATTGLSEHNELNGGVFIYPNPTSDNFTITFPSNSQNVNVTITDAIGKIVQQIKIAQPTLNLVFETSNFKSGIYFVNISSNNYKKVLKLVKN